MTIWDPNFQARSLIGQNWLFGDLTEGEAGELFKVSAVETFPKGTTLVEKGKTNNSIWILIKGSVVIPLPPGPPGSKPSTPVVLKEGDMFGEISWLDGRAASASVVTNEESSLLRIRFSELDKFLGRYSSAHISVLRKLAINLTLRIRG